MNLFEQINAEIEEMNKISEEEKRLEETKVETKTDEPKRGRPVKIDEKLFIEMWNAAVQNGSLEEVARMIGSSPASTAVKACNLRKRGVALGQFKRGRRKKV